MKKRSMQPQAQKATHPINPLLTTYSSPLVTLLNAISRISDAPEKTVTKSEKALKPLFARQPEQPKCNAQTEDNPEYRSAAAAYAAAVFIFRHDFRENEHAAAGAKESDHPN
ncbi:MAG: hypothetical protein VZR11_11495 [Succinimonas sp.]|nr:hypothetical protein [Succinimonas sp.]